MTNKTFLLTNLLVGASSFPSVLAAAVKKRHLKKNLNIRIRQKGGHTLRGGQTRRGGDACGEQDVHLYNKPRSIIFLVTVTDFHGRY